MRWLSKRKVIRKKKFKARRSQLRIVVMVDHRAVWDDRVWF
jgi:hypothetical protein